MLGHADIGTTAIYTQASLQGLRDALARLGVRERLETGDFSS
jgi:site-specific recombinase XerD